MRVVVTQSEAEFAAAAGELLVARVEHNVLATVLEHASGPSSGQAPILAYVANPTSNRIYASIGYHRVAEWEELAFDGYHRRACRA